jgi:hypothetical protein
VDRVGRRDAREVDVAGRLRAEDAGDREDRRDEPRRHDPEQHRKQLEQLGVRVEVL